MSRTPVSPEIERIIQLLARLPGLGPRSARRVTLHLLKNRQVLLDPLARALAQAMETISTCPECGNLDTERPCSLCTDPRRAQDVLCVVADVADLWALERAGVHSGLYHVLGGVLSPIDGTTPEDLGIPTLLERARRLAVKEVILALPATVEGQTTAHYIADALRAALPDVKLTRPAQGMPVGGELDYLDENTLRAAFQDRR
ncbi:recombination mediator RecR [Thermopetrobacter sp. TC1]|uniref:recombination mediator RecR n=1 Tax=Thermopetrobacter sp. TC1 TaxID=1495045 RepID=UPI00056E54A9|nr:recombination mediator RecR [Thermopetrobacter sp. TC1]